MTIFQRCILVFIAMLIVLGSLYVPFEYVDGDERYSVGYSWIFSPSDDEAVVNTSQVFFAWLGALLAGGILWFAAMPRAEKEENDQPSLGSQKSELPTDGEPGVRLAVGRAKSMGRALWRFALWALAILAVLVVAVVGRDLGKVLVQ